MANRIEFTKANKKCTQNVKRYHVHLKNSKKENSEIWSEEAIDTLINCFQSHGCMWNITSSDYKD